MCSNRLLIFTKNTKLEKYIGSERWYRVNSLHLYIITPEPFEVRRMKDVKHMNQVLFIKGVQFLGVFIKTWRKTVVIL